MNKTAISVTLAPDNLLWLRARTRATGGRSVSAALDDLVTEVRKAGGPATSVVGWVSFPEGDDGLERGQQAIRKLFERSLSPSRRRRRRG